MAVDYTNPQIRQNLTNLPNDGANTLMNTLGGYASQAGQAVANTAGNIWDRIDAAYEQDPTKFTDALGRFNQSVFEEQNIGKEYGGPSGKATNWAKHFQAVTDVYDPTSDYSLDRQERMARANPEQAAYNKAIENLMLTYQITEQLAKDMFAEMSVQDRALALEKARVDIEKSESLITRRGHLNKLTDAQTVKTLVQAKYEEAKTRLENTKNDAERIAIAKEMVLIDIKREELQKAENDNLSEAGKKLREFRDQVLAQPSIYQTEAQVQAEVERRFGEWATRQEVLAKINLDTKAQELINKTLKSELTEANIKNKEQQTKKLIAEIKAGGKLTSKQKELSDLAISLKSVAGDRLTDVEAQAWAGLFGDTNDGKNILARAGLMLQADPNISVIDAFKQADTENNYTAQVWNSLSQSVKDMKDADAAREVDKERQKKLNDINIADFSEQRTYINGTIGEFNKRLATYTEALRILNEIPKEEWTARKTLRMIAGEIKSFVGGERPAWMGLVERLEKLTTEMTFQFIAQTKGAITEKEMELFKSAVVSWNGTKQSNMDYVRYLIQKAENKLRYLNRIGAILSEPGRDKPISPAELERLRKESPDYGMVDKTMADFTKGNSDVNITPSSSEDTGNVGEFDSMDEEGIEIPQWALDMFYDAPAEDKQGVLDWFDIEFPSASNKPSIQG